MHVSLSVELGKVLLFAPQRLKAHWMAISIAALEALRTQNQVFLPMR